jgi:hypothetical protein
MKQLLIRTRNHFLPNPAVNTTSADKSLIWAWFEKVFGIERVHRLQGGLGNQMFQYAHAWALQQRFPARVRVDLCGFANVNPEMAYRIEEVFDMCDKFPKIPNNFARTIKAISRLSGKDWSFEKTLEYKDEFISEDLRGFVQGYFPSFKYSKLIEAQLRRNFVFKQSVPPSALGALRAITRTEAVAVHVRRGDYLSPSHADALGGICTQLYYRKALALVRSRIPQAKFFFFSDDPSWCRSEFGIEAEMVIEGNVGDTSWVDMMLMSRCKHAIVANSSFSLWARWLGGMSGNICIGPDRFTNAGAHGARIEDILPPEFIRLNAEGAVVWPGLEHG